MNIWVYIYDRQFFKKKRVHINKAIQQNVELNCNSSNNIIFYTVNSSNNKKVWLQ